jgi:hypothetical protein
MVAAGAYVLLVPNDRRELLLERNDELGFYNRGAIAEPVPRFKHSARAPLIVLASFKKGYVTHLADGRKGTSAGTGLIRLNLDNLEELEHAISFKTILKGIPAKFRHHVKNAFDAGGMPPPKSTTALVQEIMRLAPAVAGRLSRYSAARNARIRKLSSEQRKNLAAQKETLSLSLEIAGLPKEEVLNWVPSETPEPTFLEGLNSAVVREDVMLLKDFSNIPGFDAVNGATNVASKTFVDPLDSSRRLTVLMANELPLEEQTGADLIYFNEKYRSFVMVQYKAMESRSGKSEFRWKDGDQLAIEIARMDKILAELTKIPSNTEPNGYRFLTNPFFLKFCSRQVFNPDDKGLFPGMYLPLDFWKSLAGSGQLTGSKGGNVLTFENVGRRLGNDEFVPLVANSWVGTSISQSAIFEKVVRAILETGKTVTFAIKEGPADEDGAPQTHDINPFLSDTAEPEQRQKSKPVQRIVISE